MKNRTRNIAFVALAVMAAVFAVDLTAASRINAVSLLLPDNWPLQSGLRFHFLRARPHFEYLAETMATNPSYHAIYAGGRSLFNETCVSVDQVTCPESRDEALRRHVAKSGVFAVVNHGNTLLFGVGVTKVGNTLYTYGLARIEPDTDNYPKCDETAVDKIDFVCVLPLDSGWYIHYSTEPSW